MKVIEEARLTDTHALLIIEDGQTVIEQYFGNQIEPIESMSITKSIASLAIGLLISERRIYSIDSPVSTWYPEWTKGRKAKVTLRHILSHVTGLKSQKGVANISSQNDQLLFARNLPMIENVGVRFEYNNAATQLLSGVIEKASGVPIDNYLNEKLFIPLDIRSWTWKKDAAGNVLMYSGLSLTAGDLAKIGVVMLNNGKWNGAVVIPEEWVILTTSPAAATIPFYGLSWWLKPNQGYYADGWLGQKLIIYPALKLVAVRLHRMSAEGGISEHNKVSFPGLAELLAACLAV